MRIGILPLAAGRQAGGPETYEIECIRALARLDSANEYFVYCTGRYASDALGSLGPNVTLRSLHPPLRVVSLSVHLPALLKHDGVHLFHAMYASPPFPPKRMVSTFHGLVNFLHPEFFSPLVRLRLNPLMKLSIRRSDLTLCVSEHVKQQVHEHFGISLDRLRVSYLGVRPQFQPVPRPQARHIVQRRTGTTRPYFLYVGKRHPAKNLHRLLKAFALFLVETRADVRLVLAGAKCGDLPVDHHIAELGLENVVVQIPYVSADDLPALYSGAELFVFPSLFESFGLPVLEAMACGTPVMTSNVACLPEVTGGAALLTNPHSVESIAEGMALLHGSDGLRNELRHKGLQRARAFTWQNCARSTLSAYSEVMQSPQRVLA